MVATRRCDIATRGQDDAHDITDLVAAAVADSGVASGIVTVFVVGSTAAVTTIEFEPGAVADLNRLLEEIAPRGDEYRHHLRWGDDNGSSHVRAALLGPSLTVPFAHGTLALGTWQQIMLLELDTRLRKREIVVTTIRRRFEARCSRSHRAGGFRCRDGRNFVRHPRTDSRPRRSAARCARASPRHSPQARRQKIRRAREH